MKIFHPQAYALHAPAWYLADGSIRPCPEVPARVDAILNTLQASGLHELIPVAPPASTPLPPAITQIHAPDYLEYLRTIHTRWNNEFQTDVIPDTFPRPNACHPKSKTNPQPGDYCFDLAAPITAGTWQAILNSAQTAIAAADGLLKSKISYALCRPPGHHAGPDYCGGFCYLNNIAIAAQHLLHAGMKKVAILDLDYHHGNGTQDIFYARNDVLFVSLHADPATQYPYFWGHKEQTGSGPGEGFTLNLPLPRKSSASAWFAALETALERINLFRPEALLISLGADIHQHDPVGDFQLTIDDFAKAAQTFRTLQRPTLIIQEGGYNLETLGPCVLSTLCAFHP